MNAIKWKYILLAGVTFLLGVGITYFYIASHKTDNPAIPKAEALKIVRSLPEIKRYISQLRNRNDLYIDANEQKGKTGKKYWLVQVATINCIPSFSFCHTATFNWYTLDANTGKIKCSMLAYDNSGREIGTGNMADCTP